MNMRQREMRVRKGKGIHSVRGGLTNVPSTSVEQLGRMGAMEKKGRAHMRWEGG